MCFGGTLFEKHYHQNKLDSYAELLKHCQIDWIEISNGILDIPHTEMLKFAQQFQHSFTVVAEVGKKFSSTSDGNWLSQIHGFLDAGVRYVILEGRGSGRAGIYDDNGNLNYHLIDSITNEIDRKYLLFEAPNEQTRKQLINHLGYDVNLSNVNMQDIISIEAFRKGLSAETFFVEV